MQQIWQEPARIAVLKEDRRREARVRYYLNLAAAYFSDKGALRDLSVALGLNEAHLGVCRQRGRVSPEVAVKLESVLGREHFPRELFNDIFVVAE